MLPKVSDLNVLAEELLPTPEAVKAELPLTAKVAEVVLASRRAIERILDRLDPRLLIIVGPCSVHDPVAAKEYAERLANLAHEVQDAFLLVMRVYFAKPRTTVGWKGLINDPHLDDSFRIDDGLRAARQLLLDIGNLGIAVGTEALDSITPQYLDDVITWNAIGARTTESQTHREMASGLSTPVGFKNGTDGNVSVAINALRTMLKPHHFLGINQHGQCAVLRTKGNRYGHVILRGGVRPNYDSVSISLCEKELEAAGLPCNIVVDCSHGNSMKDHALQPLVMENCVNQIVDGNRSIIGSMIESNLFEGRQDLKGDPKQLKYGVSITDACIDWATTESLLRRCREKLLPVLAARSALG